MNERGRWRVWLTEEAEVVMACAAQAAHPRETGGVLIGVLTGTRPWITHAVHVPSKASSGTSYELPVGARRRSVDRARRLDFRVGYLGDWHSHPSDIGPSTCDFSTMAAIAADQASGCARPLLLVLRRVEEDYWVDAQQWAGRSLRPLQVLRAGPLETGAPSRRGRAKSLRRFAKSLRGRE